MQLHYVKAVHGHRLMEELQTAIPALGPLPGPDGENIAQMHLEYTATECWVTVPAATAPAEVDAVVAAHDPAVPASWEALTEADKQALTAFHTGWQLGQARLGNVGASAIQVQMDAIEAASIGTVAAAAVHIKTLAEAVEDLARQLRVLKRTVAIAAQVPDRLGG